MALSANGLRWCLLLLTLPAMSIAFYFVYYGLWMVLPFAGLEVLLVWLLFFLVRRHATDYEIVSFTENDVEITKSVAGMEEHHRFQRYWLRIEKAIGWRKSHPSRLMLGSHGQWVEVGAALNETTRQSLKQRLEILIKMPPPADGSESETVVNRVEDDALPR